MSNFNFHERQPDSFLKKQRFFAGRKSERTEGMTSSVRTKLKRELDQTKREKTLVQKFSKGIKLSTFVTVPILVLCNSVT